MPEIASWQGVSVSTVARFPDRLPFFTNRLSSFIIHLALTSKGRAMGSSEATSAIEKLGGTVEVDWESQDGSVVEVNLDGTSTTDADLAHLSSFKELRNLDLSGTQITNSGLETIGQLMRLES